MYRIYANKMVVPRGICQKILLLMRLTTVMLLATLMQVSAAGFAQKISLTERNTPLAKVFDKIRLQTGFDFVVDGTLLKTAKTVSIKVKNMELDEVLSKIFEHQPLEFTIQDKIVVVSKKESSILDNLIARFQAIDVRGRVVDSGGLPLVGASVAVKGGKGTTTDKNGNFYFAKLDEKAVLVVSFIGYLTKEINASADLSNVILEVSNSKLDEVQVIAYGSTNRRLTTGNVGTVKAVDIEKQPVQNPLLALSGRIPGLQITQATGMSGSGVKVRIQGQNSIDAGSDPLYIVDGVPYSSQLLPSINNILGESGRGKNVVFAGNPLSFINTSDIESIDVLKDADATAIYGSRGANGVILITTKKGKAGATKVDLSMQSGYGQVTRTMDMLNIQQYLQMRREAYKNDGLTVPTSSTIPNSDNYDLTFWNQDKSTNWQKELIGGTAHFTDIHGSVSGGNKNTRILIGAAYKKETTVFPGEFADQKGSVHFNISHVSDNQKFKISLSGNYLADKNELPGTDLTSFAIHLAPNAPSLTNSDGTLNWAPDTSGSSTWGFSSNPLAANYKTYINNTSNLLTNAILSYEIVPGLDLKSSFGYTTLVSSERQGNPMVAYAPERRPLETRFSAFGNSSINSWIIEPQITYLKNISRGKLEVLLGSTLQKSSNNNLQVYGFGYTSDELMDDLSLASQLIFGSSIRSQYNYNALFGRVNYNWEDKFIVNFNARKDGSSRFGSKNLFHNFWSVGGAYIFSNESFLKRNASFLSFGKFKASYGTTGNDQIGDYQFLNLYSPTGAAVPYQNIPGMLPTSLPNPNLQWEETRKLQIGLDLAVLNDRILFSAVYYRNRSSNQLLAYQLPTITGFAVISGNFPATVQNSGWEFSINTINVKTKDFSWSSNINLTIPKNKLISFPNLETSAYANSLIVGQPINIKKVYEFAGVNTSTGLYQFLDRDGLLTSNPKQSYVPNHDLTGLVNTDQKIYGGINNRLTYKDFEIDFTFQFAKQVGQNYLFGDFAGYFSGTNGNQPISVLNAWQQAGDVASVQKFSSIGSGGDQQRFAYASNAGYTDASYIRLKNLSFSWQLPGAWVGKSVLTNTRVFFQGQNLLTITNYKGLDPENQGTAGLPPLRLLTFGLELQQ